MKRLLAAVALLLGLSIARAEPKDPLNYPLKQYGFMLGIALLGGVVSWASKVRAGTLAAWNVMQFVGELATSAFAGLIAFWICEYMNCPPLLTVALVGIAGHMGTRGIVVFEQWAQRKWGVNVPDEEPKP